MGFVELLLIAIGVSMDAFAVSVGKGLSLSSVRPRHMLIAGVWFGGFQALMPVVGYLLAASFSHIVVSIDHWVAFALLSLIGLNMIRETLWGKEDEKSNNDFSAKTMAVMAVATSIDALAIGVSMAFLSVNIWLAAFIIGVTTSLFSACGVLLGRLFGARLGSKSGLVGGLVLVGIGVKILVEHLELL